MKKLTRRQFLGVLTACGATSGLGLWRTAISAQSPDPGAQHGGNHIQDRFTTQLRLPGNAGLFGIFEPSGPFRIKAMPAAQELFPGRKTPLWVYRVRQGARTFFNPIIRVKRGRKMQAILDNALPEDTIIHWHGMFVEDKFDAHPRYAIATGKSYAYEFSVANRAATYWYHPHPHGRTAAQAYAGLASLFIVEDEQELALQEALDLHIGRTDIPLVIQDRKLDAAGRLDYRPNKDELFAGYLGDTVLVNATPHPYLDVATRIYRFRILNGSNARVYRLAFAKGEQILQYQLIGNDGGLLEQPVLVREAFLAPGERIDMLLDLRDAEPGDTLYLKSLPFDPMHQESGADGHGAGHGGMHGDHDGVPDGAEFEIMKFQVMRKERFDRAIPQWLSRVEPVRLSDASSRSFVLNHRDGRWSINDWTFDMDATPVTVTRGSTEVWEIRNEQRSMPHPMHLHGFHFQVLERINSPEQVRRGALAHNGLLATDLGWKDTVLAWPGETVRLAVDFTHGFVGNQRYLFHCHNLEHEDEDMMINFDVA